MTIRISDALEHRSTPKSNHDQSLSEIQELHQQINALAEREGILSFVRGLLREASVSKKQALINYIKARHIIPKTISGAAKVEKWIDKHLQTVRINLDACLKETKRILHPISELPAQAQNVILEKAKQHGKTRALLARTCRTLTNDTLEKTRQECEEYSKATLQDCIDALHQQEKKAPDAIRQTVIERLTQLHDSISFREQGYAKLYQAMQTIRDTAALFMKNLSEDDVQHAHNALQKKQIEQMGLYNAAKNLFSVMCHLAIIAKITDQEDKSAAFKFLACQQANAKDFTGALELAGRCSNILDKQWIITDIAIKMARAELFTEAVNLVTSKLHDPTRKELAYMHITMEMAKAGTPGTLAFASSNITDKVHKELIFPYIFLMEFRKGSGLDAINTSIEKEIEKIHRDSSTPHLIAPIERPSLTCRLTALVAYLVIKTFGFFAGLFGFTKLKRKCSIIAAHAFTPIIYFLLPKMYRTRLIGSAKNIHKLRTEDVYQKQGLFMPDGICSGMSRHFLYLYLKTKSSFPEERRDIQILAVTKRFQQGAPRVSTLTQGFENFEIDYMMHDKLTTFFPAMDVAEPLKQPETNSWQTIPSGAYLVRGVWQEQGHACAYIKIDQTLSYFFDPNFGTIKFQGENSATEAAAYFNEVYGHSRKQIHLSLRPVSLSTSPV